MIAVPLTGETIGAVLVGAPQSDPATATARTLVYEVIRTCCGTPGTMTHDALTTLRSKVRLGRTNGKCRSCASTGRGFMEDLSGQEYGKIKIGAPLTDPATETAETLVYAIVHTCCGTPGTLSQHRLVTLRAQIATGRSTGQCRACKNAGQIKGKDKPAAVPEHPPTTPAPQEQSAGPPRRAHRATAASAARMRPDVAVAVAARRAATEARLARITAGLLPSG